MALSQETKNHPSETLHCKLPLKAEDVPHPRPKPQSSDEPRRPRKRALLQKEFRKSEATLQNLGAPRPRMRHLGVRVDKKGSGAYTEKTQQPEPKNKPVSPKNPEDTQVKSRGLFSIYIARSLSQASKKESCAC